MEMIKLKIPQETQIIRYVFAKRKVSKWEYFLFLIGKFKLPQKEYIRVNHNPETFAQIQCNPFRKSDEEIFVSNWNFYTSDKTPYRYFKANVVISKVGFPLITKTFNLEIK